MIAAWKRDRQRSILGSTRFGVQEVDAMYNAGMYVVSALLGLDTVPGSRSLIRWWMRMIRAKRRSDFWSRAA